eukprot:Rhum_TRINITY_DN6483_c0_g1::Rhum_TRINITY_DN6483_c0_g1_i1::g.20252::m.20252
MVRRGTLGVGRGLMNSHRRDNNSTSAGHAIARGTKPSALSLLPRALRTVGGVEVRNCGVLLLPLLLRLLLLRFEDLQRRSLELLFADEAVAVLVHLREGAAQQREKARVLVRHRLSVDLHLSALLRRQHAQNRLQRRAGALHVEGQVAGDGAQEGNVALRKLSVNLVEHLDDADDVVVRVDDGVAQDARHVEAGSLVVCVPALVVVLRVLNVVDAHHLALLNDAAHDAVPHWRSEGGHVRRRLRVQLVRLLVEHQQLRSLHLQRRRHFVHHEVEEVVDARVLRRVEPCALVLQRTLAQLHCLLERVLGSVDTADGRADVAADRGQHVFVLLGEVGGTHLVDDLHDAEHLVVGADDGHAEQRHDAHVRPLVAVVSLLHVVLCPSDVFDVDELAACRHCALHTLTDRAAELGNALRGTRVELAQLVVDEHQHGGLGLEHVGHAFDHRLVHFVGALALLQLFRLVRVDEEQRTHADDAPHHHTEQLPQPLPVLRHRQRLLRARQLRCLEAVGVRPVLNNAAGEDACGVADGVAEGGGEHRGEAEGHAQRGVDPVAAEDHQHVVQDAEADKGDGRHKGDAVQLLRRRQLAGVRGGCFEALLQQSDELLPVFGVLKVVPDVADQTVIFTNTPCKGAKDIFGAQLLGLFHGSRKRRAIRTGGALQCWVEERAAADGGPEQARTGGVEQVGSGCREAAEKGKRFSADHCLRGSTF